MRRKNITYRKKSNSEKYSLMKELTFKKERLKKIAFEENNVIEKADSKNILWKILFYEENISEKYF
jgi:hypothetical protein